jgi:hypothetical protein
MPSKLPRALQKLRKKYDLFEKFFGVFRNDRNSQQFSKFVWKFRILLVDQRQKWRLWRVWRWWWHFLMLLNLRHLWRLSAVTLWREIIAPSGYKMTLTPSKPLTNIEKRSLLKPWLLLISKKLKQHHSVQVVCWNSKIIGSIRNFVKTDAISHKRKWVKRK